MIRPVLSLAVLALAAAPALAAPVVVVKSTASAPNDAERSYAQTVTRHLDRWLSDLNVPHSVIDDDGVSASALAQSRVAVLAYNPNLPRGERKDFARFIQRGGKLIVFYSADEDLAGLMGFRMGSCTPAAAAGQWSAMRFNASAPPNVPPVVRQESRIVRPVYATAPGAAVIATWENAAGKAQAEPAWLRSSAGFWMTHVLLDDGDTWNKKQLLLALIGSCDPSVWEPAATRLLQTASTLGGRYPSFEEAVDQMTGRSRDRRVRVMLGEAGTLRDEIIRLYGERQYAAVAGRAAGLQNLMTEAYGAMQPSKRGEFRAAWNRFGTGLYPGGWDQTSLVLASHGFTDVIPFVLSPVGANCRSDVVPVSATARAYGDQMEQCLRAAHLQGLKVHAWKICWKLDGATEDQLARFRKQGRLQITDRGATIPWLCPTHPDNLTLEKDAVRDLLKRYAVDGLHLDYIRYPDGHSCFCSRCREVYARDMGRPVKVWPPAADQWELRKPYYQWRQGNITRLVRDISALSRAMRPGIRISAAVYGKYPTCAEGVGQDWPSWLRSGYLDFVCTMNYTADMTQFTGYLASQMAMADVSARIYPGIGVTATESRLDAVQVLDQVAAARAAGAGGFALFELNRVVEREILPALSLGATR